MNDRQLQTIVCGFVLVVSLSFSHLSAHASHALALGYPPKYAQNFQHFEYVNPKAPKGGVFKTAGFGSFDTLNPFLLKGSSAKGLGVLVFETLAEKSYDEPFSLYGLLADDISLGDDGLSVTFHLHPKATFSNGAPVTAEDVKFSFELLMSQDAQPFYRFYYTDIDRVDLLDPSTVRFTFKKRNPELHMIVGEIPIFSKQWVGDKPFKDVILDKPIGSGPYIVDTVKTGKEIQYHRNPDYWAKDLPVRRGMFNFDRIIIKYYRDQTVILEGLKAGEFDYLFETNSKRWAREHVGSKYDRGLIKKQLYAHRNNVGMQGFGFNLRKVIFKDQAVRKAIALAYDFEWANKNLFYDQYTRCDSYFSNSELAATGLPSKSELALLSPFKDQLPAVLFTHTWQPSSTLPPSSLRTNLRKAKKILEASGWNIKDGVLQKNGVIVAFEVMLSQKAFERILAPFAKNLKKLGIQVTYRTVDTSLYTQRLENFEFDMVVVSFGQSMSPGNELLNRFHSSSADTKGSQNTLGIKNPVVDALVEKIIYAKDRMDLVTATKALDRVLLSQDYLVTNWYINRHRVAVWDKFESPNVLPLYYPAETWSLKTWWARKN